MKGGACTCSIEKEENEKDHSSSQPSVHIDLPCPEGQRAWALAPSLSGEALAEGLLFTCSTEDKRMKITVAHHERVAASSAIPTADAPSNLGDMPRCGPHPIHNRLLATARGTLHTPRIHLEEIQNQTPPHPLW